MGTFTRSAAAVAFVALFAVSANAQETLAKVPFSFVVRGQTFPAGGYDIDNDPAQGILMIRGLNNHSGSLALSIPAAGHDPKGAMPALVFVRGETNYHLARIWESPTEGFSLVSRQAASPLAQNGTAPGAVLVRAYAPGRRHA